MAVNQIFSIRGAISLLENTKEEVCDKSTQLFNAVLKANDLKDCEIVSLVISTTGDITAFYPAAALREQLNVSCPLFSALEPPIKNNLPLCIRYLLTIANYGEKITPKHVYLGAAKNLRKDLMEK